MKVRESTYGEERTSVAEDEVDGALDVAVVVVMASLLIVERVLGAVEAAAIECGLISLNPKGHGLAADSAGGRGRSCILYIGAQHVSDG